MSAPLSVADAAQPKSAKTPRPRAFSAKGGTLLSTIVGLWPHMWPSTRADLKRRVLMAFVLLLVAKFVTISVPFSFKWATDALVALSEGRAQRNTSVLAALYLRRSRSCSPTPPFASRWRCHAASRRTVRQGRAACRAQARASHFRAHARAFAALSSRAQDRRTDAGPRARAKRHRGIGAARDLAARADHRRVRARHGRPALSRSTGAMRSPSWS